MDPVFAKKLIIRRSLARWPWLQVATREAFRNSAAELQNASILWVAFLLLLFPYRVLPELYLDLGLSLSRFQVPHEGLIYGLFLTALSFALSYQRRHHLADSLLMREFAKVLPMPRLERVLSDILLGAIAQIPIFFIQFTAAVTLLLLPKESVGLRPHAYAQAFSVVVCFTSVWIVREGKLSGSSRKLRRMPLPGALGFLLKTAVRMAPLRFLFLIFSIWIAAKVLGFRGKLDSPLTPRLMISIVGLVCMTTHWAFLPWRSRLKSVAPFLSTLPSVWLVNASGERLFITFLASLLCLFVFTSPCEASRAWIFAGFFPLVFPRFLFWIAERVPRWSFVLSIGALIVSGLLAA